jgi:hypothetical protein
MNMTVKNMLFLSLTQIKLPLSMNIISVIPTRMELLRTKEHNAILKCSCETKTPKLNIYIYIYIYVTTHRKKVIF